MQITSGAWKVERLSTMCRLASMQERMFWLMHVKNVGQRFTFTAESAL